MDRRKSYSSTNSTDSSSRSRRGNETDRTHHSLVLGQPRSYPANRLIGFFRVSPRTNPDPRLESWQAECSTLTRKERAQTEGPPS